MALGWYPGHMHKAQREIRKALHEIDVVIEVLDARIPHSSANQMLANICRNKPRVKLLSKSDLADAHLTQTWVQYLQQDSQVRALPIVTPQANTLKPIASLCRQLAGHIRADRALRVMIMGIPNVGKSTLINSLAGKRIAKVGNEPAVTKAQQKIMLKQGLALFDTPGVLWPKLDPPTCGYRLAATGAIRDTAMDYYDVGLFTAAWLNHQYPQALAKRYKLEQILSPEDTLAHIARRRGGLRAGGEIDFHKAAEALLHDLRAGHLGQLTLETPADIEKEIAEYQAANAPQEDTQTP